MDRVHVVFAGGGTGGHLYPGLAVAHAVRRLAPEARITFFTTNRKLDRELLGRTPFEQISQEVRPFTLHPLRVLPFYVAWRRGVILAGEFLRKEQPTAVLGLGGYAAGPPVEAAAEIGVRTAILNPDAIPGRANRYLARKVGLIAAQWEASRRYFTRSANVQALGCPIREEFASADREAGYARFALDPGRPVLLVTGASQGAQTINDVMCHLWPRFARRHPEWQLLHLTGSGNEAAMQQTYEHADTPAHVLGFTHEMHLALAAADVVISRAGASTLAEITALGRASILLPYPFHRDQHQTANARVLVDAGAAMLVRDQRDPDRTIVSLEAALEKLTDAALREQAAASARAIGRPHAAMDVAKRLIY
jgi:UDP-N-acetylglucosamine--N-acetylmuramyl-(pentapeptide) pyrophosphoryl-undecaprenol N-acetylglucosamine transferase